jgi:hypothetical protein
MGHLSLARHSREVTAEEIAGGAPAGGFVHEFFVTSTTDLLCVSPAQVDVPVYQHAQGSDMEPPREELTAFAPGVTADSFIDMPGDTLTLGNGWVDHTGLWGDLSNDGAQEDFLFARFTTMGETGTFSGKMFARSYDTPVSLDFSFTLPGTEADFALLEGEPTYELAHSLDPPPVVVTPPVETPPVTTPPFAGPVEPAPTPQPPIEIPPPPTYPEIEPLPQPFPPIAELPPVEVPPAEQPPGEPTPGEPGDPTPTFIDVVHCGLIIGDWASTGFTRPMVVNPDGSLVDFMHFDLDRSIDGSIPVFRTWWRQLGANTDGVMLNGGLEFDGMLDPTTVYAFSGASSASPFDLFLGDVDRPIVTQATEVRIPEPSALALLAGASVGLAAARRRPRPRR